MEPACAGKGPSRAAAPARASAFPGFRGRPRPVSRHALLPLSSACLGPRGGRLAGREPLPAFTGAESPWAQLSARDPPRGAWREASGGTPVVAGGVRAAPFSLGRHRAHSPSCPVSSRLPRCDLRGSPALAGQGKAKWFQVCKPGREGVSASVPGHFPIVSRRLRPSASPALAPFFATVKVSGWPEPDRTGRRLGRVRRKRGGALAPPPAQQARLRGRERERRATYAVCIAERAAGGGGGGGARGRAGWLAGWDLLAPV